MAESRAARAEGNYRNGVGIMLLNQLGEVFVARRIDVAGEAWQMPQGGIERDEEPREAALRELKEEIGTNKVEIVNETNTWLKYDLPKEIKKRVWSGRWRGQRQKWFVMRFIGIDSDINLATEQPEFDAWKWVPVTDLPKLAISFKRQVYIDLLEEFQGLNRTLGTELLELLDDPIIRLTMAADRINEHELYEFLRRASADLSARLTKKTR